MKQEDLIRADYLRALAVDYAKHFIGIPYAWGGDSPMEGFDCSGFVVEVLQAVGVLNGRDYSAHELYMIFKSAVVALGYAGCLAFWLNSEGKATHVEMLIDSDHTIGASGGGSGTMTIEDAKRQNAYIKIRPLNYRKEIAVIVDPFKGA